MTPLTALIWKEWREARPYLIIGLGLFLGLPVVGAAENVFHSNRRFEITTTPWVLALGGVLAVFLAVGVTTADLRPRLDDFWRSRPIGVRRWIGAKFAVALAVLLAACAVPIVAEMLIDREPPWADGAILVFLPFFWTAVFSVAFLAGCLLARPAHAATLGLAAMLLIYTMPVILPPLAWMNVADVSGIDFAPDGRPGWLELWGPHQIHFAVGMLGLSATAACVSAVAIKRNWRIAAGRKLIFALVATALLLLFASAAFQLGTNLPVLQQIDLPAGEMVKLVRIDGAGGSVMTASAPDGALQIRPFEVRPAGIVLGKVSRSSADLAPLFVARADVTRGSVKYRLTLMNAPDRNKVLSATLWIDTWGKRKPRALNLWDEPAGEYVPDSLLFLWQARLYVIASRIVVLDVSDPANPRILLNVPRAGPAVFEPPMEWDSRLRLDLLPLPGMPSAARLDATVRFQFGAHGNGLAAFDGRTLCLSDGELFVAYRLARLDETSARLVRTGRSEMPLLRALAGTTGGRVTLANGYAYVEGIDREGGTFNPGVTVLDVDGPVPMREVGHFAAPGATRIYPLPDGRAIVAGGNKLWVVGTPKR